MVPENVLGSAAGGGAQWWRRAVAAPGMRTVIAPRAACSGSAGGCLQWQRRGHLCSEAWAKKPLLRGAWGALFVVDAKVLLGKGDLGLNAHIGFAIERFDEAQAR